MKILIADDDPTSRLIAGTALRSLGHECQAVVDGDQAWDAFRSTLPDVVISDWMMPGLTGLQLCRNIRAHAPGSYTYFIMVTGQGGIHQILEGMRGGADDYLVKPLDSDDLQARLIAASRVSALHLQLARQRTELQGLNQELTVIARRDSVTGLRNRRALEEDLVLLEARVVRYGYSYCVALIDVDLFKSYNDSYGHPAGDEILKSVAVQLEGHARGGDALYRYGGDEFLCIFPEQSLATGTQAVERMRIGLEDLAIPHSASALGVLTISAGIATLDPGHARSAGEVLKEADEALYRAKQRGRNRVESAAPAPRLRFLKVRPARPAILGSSVRWRSSRSSIVWPPLGSLPE
jgi:diguanylate cyclase (GGDEF)-like protein